MKLNNQPHLVHVVLSRRNLESLLAKLNGHPPNSQCTLEQIQHDGLTLRVSAEENDPHYGERKPGEMHGETEKIIALQEENRQLVKEIERLNKSLDHFYNPTEL